MERNVGTVSLGGDSSDLTLHMDIDTDILIAMGELDSVGILLTDGTITGLPDSGLVEPRHQTADFSYYLDLLDSGKFGEQDKMSEELFPTRYKKIQR